MFSLECLYIENIWYNFECCSASEKWTIKIQEVLEHNEKELFFQLLLMNTGFISTNSNFLY